MSILELDDRRAFLKFSCKSNLEWMTMSLNHERDEQWTWSQWMRFISFEFDLIFFFLDFFCHFFFLTLFCFSFDFEIDVPMVGLFFLNK